MKPKTQEEILEHAKKVQRKEEKKNCFTISDKARCIAGSVVEILMNHGIMPH